jgi:hypothetical protein
MARLHLQKTLNGFVVADEESRELARKFKTGQVYRADIVKPRSYQSLKLFQALVSLTYSNLPERYHQLWPTPQKFRRMLADAVGHVEEFCTQDGERKSVPLSVSYDDIPDEATFTVIFGQMMAVCQHLLGIEKLSDLEGEVSKYAADHYGAAA